MVLLVEFHALWRGPEPPEGPDPEVAFLSPALLEDPLDRRFPPRFWAWRPEDLVLPAPPELPALPVLPEALIVIPS